MKYTIKANTSCEVDHCDLNWRPHVTTKDLEFDWFQSFGLGRYVFMQGEWRIRVEFKQVEVSNAMHEV